MESIFFCGIGGIGMSALARYMAHQDLRIVGSDQSDSDLLHELEHEGMDIFRAQNPQNIPAECREFIYSEAIPDDHPERQEALKRGIPQKTYFEKLGEISRDFFTICIAGTHGKSGTTTMAGLALERHHIQPNVLVGTKVFEWGNSNFRFGKSNILLVEACEYRESFLHLSPDIIVLTNLEPDHLDYYHTPEKYLEGFSKFLGKLPATGILIADWGDESVRKIFEKLPIQKIDSGEFLSAVPKLLLPGEHYRQNAAKVLALFEALELDPEIAKAALQNYRGAWRRFELKGEKDGVTVYDDYGHHPTEIRATLQTLRGIFPQQKKWIVFQPHQYSRTADFLQEFSESFSDADEILIPNIYRVRDSEAEVSRVSPDLLVQRIGNHLSPQQSVRFTEDFAKTVAILKNESNPGDVILTLGAGPVHEVGEAFLQVKR